MRQRLSEYRIECVGVQICVCVSVPCFVLQGLVFACATESGVIKLYDVRSFDKGPFDTFVVSIADTHIHAHAHAHCASVG